MASTTSAGCTPVTCASLSSFKDYFVAAERSDYRIGVVSLLWESRRYAIPLIGFLYEWAHVNPLKVIVLSFLIDQCPELD